VNNLHIITL